MPRYFIEVGYKGSNYAGFQIQQNANTIQAEIEKALQIFYRSKIELTGSSRTDAGVHAKQNYFHFDFETELENTQKAVYHLNAILPVDIVVNNIKKVTTDAHCRFDALSRSYEYKITAVKNPFLIDSAYFYPYKVDINLLNECALLVLNNTNFEGFSKKNTQVFTHNCTILNSTWTEENGQYLYNVTGSRFLRGMVRGLVGTMLLVGRSKLSITEFKAILISNNANKTDFSTPAHGLTLNEVKFNYL
jgi:tRNA pseudouridine38-40 synthase